MRNVFAHSQRWLANQQRRHASSMILYRRGVGGAVLTIPAVRGKSDAVIADGNGGSVDARQDDWIIAASDLVVNGVRFTPEPGDTITSTGGVVEEVAGNPCWRKSDPQGFRYRIHVNEVKANG